MSDNGTIVLDGLIISGGGSGGGTAGIVSGSCSTASDTAAKEVTISGLTVTNGVSFIVNFDNANTATTPTLNVNSGGAKSIYDKSGNAIDGTNYFAYFPADCDIEFMYNSTLDGYVFKNMIVESYKNGTSWYNVYSNGWKEQGGSFAAGTEADATLSFLLPFKSHSEGINYTSYSGQYLALANTAPLHTADAWEFSTKVTNTGSASNLCLIGYSSGNFYGCPTIICESGYFRLWMSSNGTSWDLADDTSMGINIASGTTMWIKFGFTGSQYYFKYNTDGGDTYTTSWSLATSSKTTCSEPFWLINLSLNSSNYYGLTMNINKTSITYTVSGVETTFFDGATATEGIDYTNNGCIAAADMVVDCQIDYVGLGANSNTSVVSYQNLQIFPLTSATAFYRIINCTRGWQARGY